MVPQSPLVPGNEPPANAKAVPRLAKLIVETGPPPMLVTVKTRSLLLPRPVAPKSLSNPPPPPPSDFWSIAMRPTVVPTPRTTRVALYGVPSESW